MTPKEFLFKKLNSATAIFPKIQCKYRFDELCCSHYVEILPRDLFENSSEIAELQLNILDEFYDLFPEDGLAFFSEGSLTKIGSADYTISGRHFNRVPVLDWIRYPERAFEISFGLDQEVSTELADSNYALAA